MSPLLATAQKVGCWLRCGSALWCLDFTTPNSSAWCCGPARLPSCTFTMSSLCLSLPVSCLTFNPHAPFPCYPPVQYSSSPYLPPLSPSHHIILLSYLLYCCIFVPRKAMLIPLLGGKGGKGLGKGGAKRHRKILRDNIQGITKPAIRRLARRGGVKRISASTFSHPPSSLSVVPTSPPQLPGHRATRQLTDNPNSDLRRDPRRPQVFPRVRHSRRCHVHRAR